MTIALTEKLLTTASYADSPLIVGNLSKQCLLVAIEPMTAFSATYLFPPAIVRQIIQIGTSSFQVDQKTVTASGVGQLLRFDARVDYSIQIILPVGLSTAIVKVWEVDGLDFFGEGGVTELPEINWLAIVGVPPSVQNINTLLAGKIDSDDPRLTDDRNPLMHTHEALEITDLSSVLNGYVLSTDPRLSATASSGLNIISSPVYAISSGDETQFGGFYKEDVFNERYDLIWLSVQRGSGTLNTAYVGQDFGSPRNLKGVTIAQWGNGNFDTNRMATDALIQTSSDGVNWFTQKSVKLSQLQGSEVFYSLNATASIVRILCGSSVPFGWHVYKVKVFS